MPITIQKSQPQVQIEPGTYMARCYSMIHIGTTSFEYMGETKKSNKVRITFELPTETKVFKEGEEPKPLVISQEYTLSLHEKSKFRPILESWRGKKFTEEEMDNFDVTKLVGVPAMISVIHNDKGYAEIATISKLPKGMECPPQFNENQVLAYDEWNEELFQKLPDFLKKKIQSSEEYQKMKGGYIQPVDANEVSPDEIPF